MSKTKASKGTTKAAEAPKASPKASTPQFGYTEHGLFAIPTTTETEDGEEVASRSITKGAIVAHYVKGLGKTSKGKATFDIADEVADRLRGLTADQVLDYTTKTLAKITGETLDLRAKYAHLNPGQIRMNCGNRLRSALKQ